MVVTSWVTITKVMLCALLCALLLMTPTLAQSPVPPQFQCASNFDCSLNGICQPNSVCLCDKPWSGDRCGILTYKKNQPLSSANLYPLNASDAPKSGPCVTSQGACNALNTWNGPIVQVSETEYHMFNPLYVKGSLFTTQDMLHGVAEEIAGPYVWHSQGQGDMGSNPAMVKFQDPENNNVTTYSLWAGQSNQFQLYTTTDLHQPFVKVRGSQGPVGGFSNAAPMYHNGQWYATDQGTRKIRTTTKLGEPWTLYSEINCTYEGAYQEDPYLWVDKRGNWHIINHAYNTSQIDHCGESTLSAHLFSSDQGKGWHMLMYPQVEPYSHTVSYEDGSSHTYATLERPNLHFDADGQLTHINVAADLMTGDKGCEDYAVCPAKTKDGKCACVNCKYADHAGSIIIALEV